MDDLPISYTGIRDESNLTREGTVVHEKIVSFFIGKFGPFHERFPRDGFDMQTVAARVEALRLTLRTLPS